MRSPREQVPSASVYWMESSKRRQALAWLERADLTAEEREALERFAERYRTDPRLGAAERRRLLDAFDRVARRLGGRRPEARPVRERAGVEPGARPGAARAAGPPGAPGGRPSGPRGSSRS